jgi:hypothetical protein
VAERRSLLDQLPKQGMVAGWLSLKSIVNAPPHSGILAAVFAYLSKRNPCSIRKLLRSRTHANGNPSALMKVLLKGRLGRTRGEAAGSRAEENPQLRLDEQSSSHS